MVEQSLRGTNSAPPSSAIELESFLEPLKIADEKLLLLAKDFTQTFSELARTSTEQFLPTPVTTLPKGSEEGTVIAIDIGGSRMRIAFVEFHGTDTHAQSNGESSCRVVNKHSWNIEDLLKTGKLEDLFDWIGERLCEVLDDRFGQKESLVSTIRAGVTFSFPMQQEVLSTARLMPQGKGFHMSADHDMATLLRNGYRKAVSGKEHPYPDIDFCAIANDTVSTLAAASYIVGPGKDVAMAIVLGTGTNAASLLPASLFGGSKLGKLSGASSYVVNTEWGIRGTAPPLDSFHLRTKWDMILDKNHDNPGFMPFEHMTGGRYLGEITRIVFRDYLDQLPQEKSTQAFLKPYELTTEAVSALLCSSDFASTPLSEGEARHADAIRVIGGIVAERSAALLAAACVGLVECSKQPQGNIRDEIAIAIVGTTFNKFPQLREQFEAKVNTILQSKEVRDRARKAKLYPIKDGGIIGAAVLACTSP